MSLPEILIIISFAILFYSYLGYGIIIWAFTSLRNVSGKNKETSDTELLPVTLVITAYNELPVLESKVKNSLGLDYPAELLHFIFVTDGSTDGSPVYLHSYPRIQVLHQEQRQGKYAAIARAMSSIKTPIVVFSDSNAMLNPSSIRLIVRHYADPKVGGVAGEKKILQQQASAVGAAEGLYWQYESLHKKLDAAFYSVVGAAGELFSIRTALFKPLPKPVILDDFLISVNTCLQGYRMAYEPGAFASEAASSGLQEEMKRKVRIAAGAYQAIGLLPQCLNFFRYPRLAFQFVSRRLLRWVFCPLMLPVFFFASLFAFISKPVLLHEIIFFTQVIFYLGAAAGWVLAAAKRSTGLFTIPFYFIFMNYCMARGFVRFLRRKQTVLWEKSQRETIA